MPAKPPPAVTISPDASRTLPSLCTLIELRPPMTPSTERYHCDQPLSPPSRINSALHAIASVSGKSLPMAEIKAEPLHLSVRVLNRTYPFVPLYLPGLSSGKWNKITPNSTRLVMQ